MKRFLLDSNALSHFIMQTIDRMIAAVALTLPNCTLVSCDSDFSRVPGLKVENWES